MARRKGEEGEPVIVKKYANRRLYNTSTSSYITLDDLARMVRENVDFQVIDAKSGEDITRSILTQIIMEQEASGERMLPLSFLRQLIGLYGNSVQTLMPSYLEAAMNNFRDNQGKLREALEKGIAATPLARLHETNMAMMRAASEAFLPRRPGSKDTTSARPGETAASRSGEEEIAQLKEQMAQMQKKLDELSKR